MATTDHRQTIRQILINDGFDPNRVYARSRDNSASTPKRVISMTVSGGSASPYLGTDYVDDLVRVTLLIRAPQRDQSDSDAREVMDVLTTRRPSGYVKVHRTGPAIYAGVDEDGLHLHTLDVDCEILE